VPEETEVNPFVLTASEGARGKAEMLVRNWQSSLTKKEMEAKVASLRTWLARQTRQGKRQKGESSLTPGKRRREPTIEKKGRGSVGGEGRFRKQRVAGESFLKIMGGGGFLVRK